MKITPCDILIVGGGIIGLAVARELVTRGVHDIILVEKESELGLHASGRNSGVLHAGIYYGTDSLKARLCSQGAQMLFAYAVERKIAVSKVGKVIVASQAADLPQIDVLYERSRKNNIPIQKISETHLHEIEPLAHTVESALFSPNTAIIDSKAVLKELQNELTYEKVKIIFSETVETIDPKRREATTKNYRFHYGHLINAAGLHADVVAHAMGVGSSYRLLPFKGAYRKLKTEAASRIRGLIYPVPNLSLPFLGVHLTRTTQGTVLVGPTASPAFGRENYKGLDGIRLTELPRIVKDLSSMIVHNRSHLGSHIIAEMRKYMPGGLLHCAQELVPSLRETDFSREGKVGIRAQLVDIRNMELVMDFVIEQGPNSTHILNAVSPAFTSSLAFAKVVVDRVLAKTIA